MNLAATSSRRIFRAYLGEDLVATYMYLSEERGRLRRDINSEMVAVLTATFGGRKQIPVAYTCVYVVFLVYPVTREGARSRAGPATRCASNRLDRLHCHRSGLVPCG